MIITVLCKIMKCIKYTNRIIFLNNFILDKKKIKIEKIYLYMNNFQFKNNPTSNLTNKVISN